MNKKNKIILIIVLLAGIIGAGFYFLKTSEQNPDESLVVLPDPLFGWKFPENTFPLTKGSSPNVEIPSTKPSKKNLFDYEIAYSTIRDPGGIPEGLPIRLKVPAIGVDSLIEDALITPDGKMDVTAGSENVGWFALGPNPGEIGSAVIGGHYGMKNGMPAVFYYLDQMKVGDKIYIENDKGDTLAFQVRKIELFERQADATTVFTSKDRLAHLNLITCEGIWNIVDGNYPLRRVVFADAIPSEGAVTVSAFRPSVAPAVVPSSTPTPTPSIVPGTMPSPTPVPTPIPVPTPTPTPTPTPIPTPTTNISRNSPVLPETFIMSTKSLFSPPIYGLITSVLLLSIIFVSFKLSYK